MMKNELLKYKTLNELADKNGIVVFGGSEDMNVPLGELKQAFDIDSKMYNRSISGLSINDAISAYDACVAPLSPETVLLHIGSADLDSFEKAPSAFDYKYRELIAHIRSQNKKCRIVVISLKNYENNDTITEMNRHLEYIADSEKCEYGNIAAKRVWNLRSSMETASFLHNLGIIRPLASKRPVYDLVRMIFCYGT